VTQVHCLHMVLVSGATSESQTSGEGSAQLSGLLLSYSHGGPWEGVSLFIAAMLADGLYSSHRELAVELGARRALGLGSATLSQS
jgi:hypothetical protein